MARCIGYVCQSDEAAAIRDGQAIRDLCEQHLSQLTLRLVAWDKRRFVEFPLRPAVQAHVAILTHGDVLILPSIEVFANRKDALTQLIRLASAGVTIFTADHQCTIDIHSDRGMNATQLLRDLAGLMREPIPKLGPLETAAPQNDKFIGWGTRWRRARSRTFAVWDPAMREQMDLIVQLCDTGWSNVEVAKWLNSLGMRRPKTVSAKRWLDRPRYRSRTKIEWTAQAITTACAYERELRVIEKASPPPVPCEPIENELLLTEE